MGIFSDDILSATETIVVEESASDVVVQQELQSVG